jgi:hypothetical protein
MAVLGAVAMLLMGTSGLYAASPTAATTTTDYVGAPIGARVLATNANWLNSASVALHGAASTNDRAIPFRRPASTGAGPNLAASAPAAAAAPFDNRARLTANFDGVTDTQNHALNGFHVTPPDQGLCVGYLGGFGGKVVIEVVNDTFGIYTPTGTPLSAFTVAQGFNDPNAFSDPRCFYDPATSSFYMTVISCASCTTDTFDDVLVVNRSGQATTYQFDSTFGGTCFGDQPHTGYDSNALFVSTDEFCGPGQSSYDGALLIAISKSQLAAQVASPNAVSFGLLSLGGVPILTLQPAVGNGSGREYLLNSFPYDAFGNNNSISSSLGLWTVKGGENMTDGSGSVTLSGRLIGSETYAFPVPAASTGNGSTPAGSPSYVISEPFLNPDDSRMQQVQLVADGFGGPRLYASLSSAVALPGDPSARDGAAWFVVDPQQASVARQGYVGVRGASLLYPAILHSQDGLTAMAFTITSPTLNPSAAYAVSRFGGFGTVHIVAQGSGPHVSFSDVLFGQGRWGDYSAEVLDPGNGNIWSATEYIGPPPGGTDLVDNWGTRIWKLTGNE